MTVFLRLFFSSLLLLGMVGFSQADATGAKTPTAATDVDLDALIDDDEWATGRDPLLADYAVSAGYHHSCALDDRGVHCWGEDARKSLANPPLFDHPRQIDVGDTHACVLDDEGVKCWGDNLYGKVTVPKLEKARAVSVGWFHSCALTGKGVKCWGDNRNGQLDVPKLKNVQSIGSGGGFSCALTNKKVFCWGDNWAKQTDVPSLKNPRQISVGVSHVCALDDSGVQCWGDNTYKQSVDDSKALDYDHNPYHFILKPVLHDPRMVSAGFDHSCAIDVGADETRRVRCWGNNRYGQSEPPEKLLKEPVAVSAGWYHSCALDSEGMSLSVKCWGEDSYKQTVVPPLFFDTDRDGIANKDDKYPLDFDNDGIPDTADKDNDNDIISDDKDNCPHVYNPDQKDTNGNAQGDACDPDIDGDGWLNADDAFPLDKTEQVDINHNHIGDKLDAKNAELAAKAEAKAARKAAKSAKKHPKARKKTPQ